VNLDGEGKREAAGEGGSRSGMLVDWGSNAPDNGRLTRRILESVAEVQVFGIRKSADTRKALRFFSERRIKTHFVDLAERVASRGELNRFANKFGVEALIDRSSVRFRDLGLVHARLSDEAWLGRLVEEPFLLRMPLVRSGQRLTVGFDEKAWREWTGR
jgi:arsenate reductase (glutaredoxin)